MERTPLRGRAEQMDCLLGLLRRVRRTGRAAAAVVQGSAGSGKSALLAEAAEQAERLGFRAGRGRAGDFPSVGSLALLFSALRSGPQPLLSAKDFDDLAPLHDHGPWLVDRLAAALAERAARDPLLIVLDDADRADELSSFALGILPGRLAAAPVVWLLAGRTAPLKPDDLASWALPSASVVLGPLTEDAIGQLAADRMGGAPDERVRALLPEVGGNPRLAVDLVAGLAEERDRGREPTAGLLPERILSGVRAILANLTPGAARLLRVGSVLGRSFEVRAVAELAGGDAHETVLPCVAELVHADLLVDDGRNLEFRVSLLHRAVYEDIPPTVRYAMHRAAARYLADVADDPVRAAGHVLRGGAPDDAGAVGILRRAAAAVVESEPETAVRFVRAALDVTGPDQQGWAELCEQAVDVFARAGHAEEAVQTARRRLDQGTETDVALRVEAFVVEPLWRLGRLEELRERAEKLLCVGGHSDCAQARLLAQAALGASRDRDLGYARSAAGRALELADELGSPQARSLALWASAEVEYADGALERALELFRARRLLAGPRFAADEIRLLQALDRFDESAELLGRLRRSAEPDSAPEQPAGLLAARETMRRQHALGALDGARAAAERTLELGRAGAGDPSARAEALRAEALLVLADVARMRGDLSEAARWIDAPDSGPHGDDDSSALARLLLADCVIAADRGGESAAALEAVRRVVDAVESGRPRLRWEPWWTPAAARAAVRHGDRALARRVACVARAAARRNPGVSRLEAVALWSRGLADDDASLLAEAVGLLRPGARRPETAGALVDYGDRLARDGQRGLAVQVLGEAGALWRELGAVGEVRRVQRLLREFGVRRRWTGAPARPPHGWEALTDAERRVARLVADGHSNKAVAAELFLSPNTVGTHLRSVFAKLDVNSRAQLVRAVPPGGTG